ncbi:MAG: DnaA/Hda family protein [Pseudomonadota bacterium]
MPAASFADIVISPSNAGAVEIIQRWEDWQGTALCLVGPPASGLGVLIKLWSEAAVAHLIDAETFDLLTASGVEQIASGRCAIDLAEAITNEDNLLTALNTIYQRQGRLLMTARNAPAAWDVTSADLASRLRALPTATIGPPDDEMVRKRLKAACRRRYLKLSKEETDYIAVRLERSYEAIEDYVQRLDFAVSESGRPPSIHLARSVLEEAADANSCDGDLPD